MKLTDLLQGLGSSIAFYPDLVPIVGSHHAAIFLCQLSYWQGKQHNPDGWIYKTQEQWFWETNLTDKQQKNARELLVSRGFIEERYRGIPRRLEYRLKEQDFNEIWEAWTVAMKLKKDLIALDNEYGVGLSRGIPDEDIQARMKLLREGVRESYGVLHSFFDDCSQSRGFPLKQLDRLKLSLAKIAETIEKSIISQWGILISRTRRNRAAGKRDNLFHHRGDPPIPNRSFRDGSNPVAASCSTSPKTTAKTTTKTTQKNTHSGEFFFKGENVLKTCLWDEDQGANEIEVKVKSSKELNQQNQDQEIGSQGKTKILIETNIPGAENHSQKLTTEQKQVNTNTLTPCVVLEPENGHDDPENDWVRELEEIIRNGDTLPRSELFKLANFRLGEYVHLYRYSGRVLDASPNDFNQEFLRFVQWYSFDGDPNLTFVIKCVKKYERNPEEWDVLMSWLQAFQEVQADPTQLETILSDKVASQGKNPNKRDLRAINSINIDKIGAGKNWWELI